MAINSKKYKKETLYFRGGTQVVMRKERCFIQLEKGESLLVARRKILAGFPSRKK